MSSKSTKKVRKSSAKARNRAKTDKNARPTKVARAANSARKTAATGRETAAAVTGNPPQTFQGRRIRMITWRGVECPAVEGLVVLKRRTSREARGLEGIASAAPSGASSSALSRLGLAVVAVPALPEGARMRGDRPGPALAEATGAEWSEPVLLDRISRVPSDPLVTDQWGFDAIGAGVAFDGVSPTAGVLLAILDSGLPMQAGMRSHSDLQGDRFALGRDVVNGDDIPADDHGHGTHVLGIAAATADNATGVAGLWQGGVLVVKVFDSQGNGSSVAFADGVTAAVDFATAEGLRLVISYSGGGPESDTKTTAVDFARDNGALIVAAAGNNFGSPIEFPAAYSLTHDNVLAVGAITRDRVITDFCNLGPAMNLLAPGADIISTLPDYFVTLNGQGKQTRFDRLDGTSQATPLVSAAAALFWARNPAASAAQVRARLLATAEPLDDPNAGSGILNVERTLRPST